MSICKTTTISSLIILFLLACAPIDSAFAAQIGSAGSVTSSYESSLLPYFAYVFLFVALIIVLLWDDSDIAVSRRKVSAQHTSSKANVTASKKSIEHHNCYEELKKAA